MEEQQGVYYTYILRNSLTGLVFYVGKGKDYRLKDHENEARKGVHSPKCEMIRQIWKQGGEILREKVREHLSEDQALRLEAQLIDEYGWKNLTNIGLERRQEKESVRVPLWLNGERLEQVAACMEKEGIEYSSLSCTWYIRDICEKAISDHIAKLVPQPLDN